MIVALSDSLETITPLYKIIEEIVVLNDILKISIPLL